MVVSQALLHAGVYAPPIVQIGIPKDQPRIRFFISATHTPDDIDRTIAIIAQAIASESGPMVSAAGG
jgi:7-keto-8-aminopelargonate synthetase-like enzyme